MLTLSILDQSPVSKGKSARTALQETVLLAQRAEEWGYHRFWVSEHHNMRRLAGSTPEVLLAHLGAKTSTIRIGSGGVMLPHYSAYKVAENFRMLEALYPGRVDLGIGRAPGGMPIATMALQEGKYRNVNQYPQQIDDLTAYLHDATGDEHRFSGLKATPLIDTVPELWVLGSSGESARIAAEKGAYYSFAHFINAEGGPSYMRYYRKHFQRSVWLERPETSVSVFVFCAKTEHEAEELAAAMDLNLLMIEQGIKSDGIPSIEEVKSYRYTPYELERIRENRKRFIFGTPDKVKEQLLAFAKMYETEEVIVVTIAHSFEAKLKSYCLLMEEMKKR